MRYIVVAGINYLHACYLLHRMVSIVTHVPVLLDTLVNSVRLILMSVPPTLASMELHVLYVQAASSC